MMSAKESTCSHDWQTVNWTVQSELFVDHKYILAGNGPANLIRIVYVECQRCIL